MTSVNRRHAGPHPRETSDRCALRAQLRGDPMVGSAFPAGRVLLVEQPGPWGRDGLPTSHFDRAVAEALQQRAGSAGIRVQAIRRPGRTTEDGPRRWALADCRPDHESLRWGSFDRDAELVELPLDGSVGEPDDQPLYLVCTHSKHDTCCALRGRPVAAALHEQRPGRVFETSHVGGDRFAANVLVLPAGLLYGRVLTFAAPEFVAAAEAGEVVPALLRGRIGLPATAQAALAFAYEHLALRRRDALRVRQAGPTVNGVAVIGLDGPHGPIEVSVAVDTVEATGLTCANPRANRYLSYRLVAVTAA